MSDDQKITGKSRFNIEFNHMASTPNMAKLIQEMVYYAAAVEHYLGIPSGWVLIWKVNFSHVSDGVYGLYVDIEYCKLGKPSAGALTTETNYNASSRMKFPIVVSSMISNITIDAEGGFLFGNNPSRDNAANKLAEYFSKNG